MGNSNNLSGKTVDEAQFFYSGVVGVNLTRLISGASGAGGAGVFSLFLARGIAKVSRVNIYHNSSNFDLVNSFVERNSDAFQHAKLIEVSFDNFHHNLEEATKECNIWIDPLNGLEPKNIAKNTISVSVIHDLLFQNHPQFFSQKEINFRSQHYGDAIDRSDLVLTVSDFEKESISTRFGKADVDVIYQPAYYTAKLEKRSKKGNIIFYPAVQWNHKNHLGLIEAFLTLCENKSIPEDTRLLLSGVKPVEDNTRIYFEILEKSPFKNRVIQVPYLTSEEYDKVMNSCIGFVFPSIYEGYGLPALEAALNGIPMMSSMVPSISKLSKIPHNFLILENPENPAEFLKKLKQFINETPPHNENAAEEFEGVDYDNFDNQIKNIIEQISKKSGYYKNKLVIDNSNNYRPKISQRSLGLTVWVDCVNVKSYEELNTGLDAFRKKLTDKHDFGQLTLRPIITPELAMTYDSSADYEPIIYRNSSIDEIVAYNVIFCKTECLFVTNFNQMATCDVKNLNRAFELMSNPSRYSAVEIDGELNTSINSRIIGILNNRILNLQRFGISVSDSLSSVADKLRRRLTILRSFKNSALHVIDPALKDDVGHHCALARMWINGAQKLGMRTSICTNKDAKIGHLFPSVDFHKLFSDFLYGNVVDIGLFEWELNEAAQKCNYSGGDYVVMFCATPAMLAGTIVWLLSHKPENRPIFLVRFDRPEERTPRASMDYEEVFANINRLNLRKYFKFYTESKALQDYFTDLAKEEFPMLFNPLPDAAQDLNDIFGVPKLGKSNKSKRIKLGYLGEARWEKGFEKLPFIIEYLMAIPEISDKIEFVIQVSIGPQNQVPGTINAKKAILELAEKYGNIETKEYLTDSQYVSTLRSLDLLLLPYDLAQYAVRGSGVATEAIAACIPMVVARGLDLAKTFAGVGVIEPSDHSIKAFALATKEAILNIDSYKNEISNVRKRIPKFEIEDDKVIKRMCSDVQDSGNSKGCALILVNDTYGEGNTAVFNSQKEFLKNNNYGYIELEIPYPNEHVTCHADEALEVNAFANKLFYSVRFKDCDHYRSVLHAIRENGHSFDLFESAWKNAYIPKKLADIIQNNEFEFVIVNYSHHFGVLKYNDIVPKSPIIVEAHDIQAFQYAIQQNRLPDQREIEEELETLKQFDHVVSISKVEEVEIAKYVGAENVTWCLPSTKEQISQTDNSSIRPDDYHILFVGSSHPANMASLHWFLQNVYEPELFPKGYKVGLVGNSSNHIDTNRFGDSVIKYGRVADLTPFYEAAKIIALPVMSGAGVPIKVLDAFRHNRPFSLHSFPSKAIGLPEDFPTVDSAIEMANDILAVLTDTGLAKARAKLGNDFYKKHASPTAVSKKWEEIVDSAKKRFNEK